VREEVIIVPAVPLQLIFIKHFALHIASKTLPRLCAAMRLPVDVHQERWASIVPSCRATT
jgi:hypothetical protein